MQGVLLGPINKVDAAILCLLFLSQHQVLYLHMRDQAVLHLLMELAYLLASIGRGE